jgi:hypothetical protein
MTSLPIAVLAGLACAGAVLLAGWGLLTLALRAWELTELDQDSAAADAAFQQEMRRG